MDFIPAEPPGVPFLLGLVGRLSMSEYTFFCRMGWGKRGLVVCGQ